MSIQLDHVIVPARDRTAAAMLVQQSTTAAFMAFATNADCLAGIGRRTAAPEDSRLLPLQEGVW